MRRTFAFTVFASLLFGLPGCGDPDAGKLFADIQYGTRCPTSNHCAAPQDRDICGVNNGTPCEGVSGTARVSCSVREDTMGNYVMDFSADQGMGYVLQVVGATVSPAGGLASGANCSVRVDENPNRYEGDCITGEPSAALPGCRLSNIAFTSDMGNPTVSGQIECRDIPSSSNPDLKLDVTRIGPSPTDAAAPGTFRIANCMGLDVGEE